MPRRERGIFISGKLWNLTRTAAAGLAGRRCFLCYCLAAATRCCLLRRSSLHRATTAACWLAGRLAGRRCFLRSCLSSSLGHLCEATRLHGLSTTPRERSYVLTRKYSKTTTMTSVHNLRCTGKHAIAVKRCTKLSDGPVLEAGGCEG